MGHAELCRDGPITAVPLDAITAAVAAAAAVLLGYRATTANGANDDDAIAKSAAVCSTGVLTNPDTAEEAEIHTPAATAAAAAAAVWSTSRSNCSSGGGGRQAASGSSLATATADVDLGNPMKPPAIVAVKSNAATTGLWSDVLNESTDQYPRRLKMLPSSSVPTRNRVQAVVLRADAVESAAAAAAASASPLPASATTTAAKSTPPTTQRAASPPPPPVPADAAHFCSALSVMLLVISALGLYVAHLYSILSVHAGMRCFALESYTSTLPTSYLNVGRNVSGPSLNPTSTPSAVLRISLRSWSFASSTSCDCMCSRRSTVGRFPSMR